MRNSSKKQLNKQIENYKTVTSKSKFENIEKASHFKRIFNDDDELDSCKLSIDPLIQDYCTSKQNDLVNL